jgi:hypothetical protein
MRHIPSFFFLMLCEARQASAEQAYGCLAFSFKQSQTQVIAFLARHHLVFGT